jgi:4-hydroxyacetophenone monooxygenase
MLVDNGWFRTLTRPNVVLVTDPIVSVTPTGVVTGQGDHRQIDVLILATGFEALNILGHIHIVGRGGVTLEERWGTEDARAYLGIAVPGFPNFFVLYGPNTNLGHGGSIIFHAECQLRYLMSLLEQMVAGGLGMVEIRQDVHDRYNEAVDAEHEAMVWTHPGVAPWYRNSKGRVVSNSPWRLVDYWHMTRRADLEEYVVGVSGGDRIPTEERL